MRRTEEEGSGRRHDRSPELWRENTQTSLPLEISPFLPESEVHVFFPLTMFTLATAYRWRAEQAAVGDEPVGWRRWRRQLFQQNRDKVVIFAQGWYGIFHVAEYSLLLGVKLQEPPPEIGSRRDVLKKYGLLGHA